MASLDDDCEGLSHRDVEDGRKPSRKVARDVWKKDIAKPMASLAFCLLITALSMSSAEHGDHHRESSGFGFALFVFFANAVFAAAFHTIGGGVGECVFWAIQFALLE